MPRGDLASYRGTAFLGIDAGSTTFKAALIGQDGDDEITSMELGEVGGTSNGHVCCSITSRPFRHYING